MQCVISRERPGTPFLALARHGSEIPGQNLRALVHGKGRRFAGWIAKMLTPTSRDAHWPFGRTSAESGPIPRVLARRSQFAFLLTVPDLVLPLERNTLRCPVLAVLRRSGGGRLPRFVELWRNGWDGRRAEAQRSTLRTCSIAPSLNDLFEAFPVVRKLRLPSRHARCGHSKRHGKCDLLHVFLANDYLGQWLRE